MRTPEAVMAHDVATSNDLLLYRETGLPVLPVYHKTELPAIACNCPGSTDRFYRPVSARDAFRVMQIIIPCLLIFYFIFINSLRHSGYRRKACT